MKLTDAQLDTFDRLVLRLPDEKRKEYSAQIAHLIERLTRKASEDETLGVIKVLQAGSFAKRTVLRPRDGYGVDADIAVYLDVAGGTQYELDTLHARIRKLLIAIYPQKRPEDFEVQPRTLGITFHESGLDIDLVPVIPVSGPGDYSLQPSSRGQPPTKTSIPGQLAFVQRRADSDPRYRKLVRVVKRWRNHQELAALGSYAIELLVAYLQDQDGPAERLESGLLRFFLFVAQTRLESPIRFLKNGTAGNFPKDPVVILDPVNSANNVTSRVTKVDREEIVLRANAAWETLTTAIWNEYKGETLDLWREILGTGFMIEEPAA